tara:strand:+ start:4025 stop:4795 length:771 start_codon:yes stop_codon:yes gene_type:complete
MSQQVRVEQELVFAGSAENTGNIEGRPSYKNAIVYYDDFVGKAIDNTNDYTVAGVNSGDATVTVPHMMTLTTGTADDDDVDVAMGVEWYGRYNATLEARFRIDDVDKTAVNIGFSDATGEAADLIAMMYSGTTLTSTASEFAGFLHDTDATTSNVYGVSVKGDSDGAVINSASAPTDAKLYTVRVVLRDNGSRTDAIFYVNTSGLEIDPANDLIGIEIDAVTRTTALCPYIALINHGEAAANTLDVDYLKLWQDRQ